MKLVVVRSTAHSHAMDRRRASHGHKWAGNKKIQSKRLEHDIRSWYPDDTDFGSRRIFVLKRTDHATFLRISRGTIHIERYIYIYIYNVIYSVYIIYMNVTRV